MPAHVIVQSSISADVRSSDDLLDSGASFNVDLPRNNFKTSTNWSSRIVQGFNSCNLGTIFKVIISFFFPPAF